MKDLSSSLLTWPDKENRSLIICFLNQWKNTLIRFYIDSNLHVLFQDHPQKENKSMEEEIKIRKNS